MKKKTGAQKHASMKKKLTGVSENSGTPKWMVKIMENPIFKMDDLGGFNPLFSETTTYTPPECKGQGAFAHCGALTSVDLTEVKELKAEAFQRCGSLRHVILPNVTRRAWGFFNKKKVREKTDGNGWTWNTWASVFLFCVLTIWKFQRLSKWAARYSCSSTWADVFFIDYQKWADTILFKYVIANCVIFNDSSNDLSFFPNGNTNPTRKTHVRKTWRINVAINLLILGSTKGLYPKKLSKNTVWLRWMSFFSCSFFWQQKNHTHRTVKLIVVRAFQCHMFLCVNGLVETLSPHTHPSFNNVWYFGWSLTF